MTRAAAFLALAAVALVLAACREDDVALVEVTSHFALTTQQQSECPSLPSFVSLMKARLIIQGQEATPCELTVAASNGQLNVSGQCKVLSGPAKQVTLLWYAKGAAGNEVTLAQSFGVANLQSPGPGLPLALPFIPQMQPVKTAAVNGDPVVTRNIYNCDRTGTNVCNSNDQPPGTLFDTDTCSNLEELCQNTLFDSMGNAVMSTDKCPNGPGPCRACPTCLPCN